MTEQVGLLDRARLRRKLGDEKLRAEKLGILHDIGTAIASSVEVEVILARVVEAASYITHAEEASLLLLDEKTKELYLRAQKGLGEKYARGFSIRIEDSIAGEVIKTAKPQRLASEDQNLKVVTGYMVNSIVYVPVTIRGRVIGVLSVDNKIDTRSFSKDDENLLSFLAGYSAIALENAHLMEELDSQSHVLSDLYGIGQIKPSSQLDLNAVSVVLYQSPELVPSKTLLPQHLSTMVDPYLRTLTTIQHLIDEIEGKSPTRIEVLAITHDLPAIASVKGIHRAVEIINQTVVPWKKESAESMAQFLLKEKETAVRKAETEVLEARAWLAEDKLEEEQLRTEVAIQRAEVEALRWQNEHQRLKLQHKKIDLALDFILQVNPDLSTQETIAYVVRLLPDLDHLIASPLQVCTAREHQNGETLEATTVIPSETQRLQIVQ